ncbi:hypothetical protein BDW75DRAFT_4954 [Aspergillus navahoensis]
MKIPRPAEDAISTRLFKSLHQVLPLPQQRTISYGQGSLASRAWPYPTRRVCFGLDDTCFDQLRTVMVSDNPPPVSNNTQQKELQESILCRRTTPSPRSCWVGKCRTLMTSCS